MAMNPLVKRSAFGMTAMLLTGILSFAMVVFFIGEGVEWSLLQPGEKMMFYAIAAMLGGLWIGMLHSLSGGLITVAAFVWFLRMEGAFSLGVMLYAFPITALMHLLHALLIKTTPTERKMTDDDRRRARIREVREAWEAKQGKKRGPASAEPHPDDDWTEDDLPPPPLSPRPTQPPRQRAVQTSPPRQAPPRQPAPAPPKPPPREGGQAQEGATLGSPGDGRASAPLPGWLPEDSEGTETPPPRRRRSDRRRGQ